VGQYFVGEDCSDEVWSTALHSTYLLPLDAVHAASSAEDRNFVSFANYDYLGLQGDLRIKQVACDMIMTGGVGAGASRLVGGERTIHGALERDLALFLDVEDALALVSGYLTNVSLVGHLLERKDLILADEFVHNSAIVGARLSQAPLVRFRHNDLDHLEQLLARRRGAVGRVLIVAEGLYSMDGDIPDLPRLVEIKERYDAWLMLDEAHSIGVLGASGRGITEHFGIEARRIDFIVGTLSKAFAGCGGFVASGKDVVEWLRFTLPASVFSVGMSPVIAAAVRKAIAILQSEPWRLHRLRANSSLFVEEARARNLDTGPALGTGTIPIFFDTREACVAASRAAMASGYYAPPIAQMAVPTSKPRIRFFITAAHTREQITGVLDAIAS
jgi:7-keto-8-aminopelargonate synthetase-like enzyme